MADAPTPKPQPSRLQRALDAWQKDCARREPPDHPTHRVLEALMGQPSITDASGQRRFITPADELEHLRLWTVFECARCRPLLEALSTFSVEVDLHRTAALLRSVTDLRNRHGLRTSWMSTMQIETRDMHRAGWFEYARVAVRDWLGMVEAQVAERIDRGD
jgi:hypothetical protein